MATTRPKATSVKVSIRSIGLCLREHSWGKDNSGGGEHDGEADEHGFLPKDKP